MSGCIVPGLFLELGLHFSGSGSQSLQASAQLHGESGLLSTVNSGAVQLLPAQHRADTLKALLLNTEGHVRGYSPADRTRSGTLTESAHAHTYDCHSETRKASMVSGQSSSLTLSHCKLTRRAAGSCH